MIWRKGRVRTRAKRCRQDASGTGGSSLFHVAAALCDGDFVNELGDVPQAVDNVLEAFTAREEKLQAAG